MCYQQSPFKANGLFSQIVCTNNDPPLPLLSPTSLHSLGRVWRDQVNFSINSFQFSKMSGHLGARFVADDSLWDHFDNIVIHYVEFQKCWPFLRIWLAAWTCWHGWCVSAGTKTWPWSKHSSELFWNPKMLSVLMMRFPKDRNSVHHIYNHSDVVDWITDLGGGCRELLEKLRCTSGWNQESGTARLCQVREACLLRNGWISRKFPNALAPPPPSARGVR